jgi:hypothetical protein
MAYSFGDVVSVPFPFTDQSGVKNRPAVIVVPAARKLEVEALAGRPRVWALIVIPAGGVRRQGFQP